MWDGSNPVVGWPPVPDACETSGPILFLEPKKMVVTTPPFVVLEFHRSS